MSENLKGKMLLLPAYYSEEEVVYRRDKCSSVCISAAYEKGFASLLGKVNEGSSEEKLARQRSDIQRC